MSKWMVNMSLIVVAGCSVMMAGCSGDTEIFNPAQQEKTQKEAYTANFISKYGDIDPNQTWDFTSGLRLATRADDGITVSIIDGLDFGVTNNKITKNNSIYDAIKTVLPERVVHEGKPAVLVAPASSFYIFPISTQGRWTHDLKIRVGNGEPVQLYTKKWTDWSIPYVNGMTSGGYTIDMKGIYVQAPVGTPIEIYLDNVNSNTTGDKPNVGTTNGQAIYVDVPESVTLDLGDGVNLKEGAVIKYIGIEDCMVTSGSEATDNDFNDVVLAVVGNPDVPQEVIITNETYTVVTSMPKRYLVEDLGAIDDFDFNDIVVDVVQEYVTTHKVTYENNVRKTDEVISTEASGQKAIVRAMGGTLDFTLKVGNATWKKSEAGFTVATMYNTQGSIDYSAELATFDVTGWVPEENNVSVDVKESSGAVYTVTFPKKGTAPMIIAVNPEQNWMGERRSIPASWFTVE